MIKSVLLAAKIDPDNPEIALEQLRNLKYPVLGSPKVDGIRCHIDRGAYSRKNKPIPNRSVQNYLTHMDLNLFDGELVVGSPFSGHCFNTTQSGVMSVDGEPNFKYFVFDLIGPEAFYIRSRQLKACIENLSKIRFHRLISVPQKTLYNPDEVLGFEARMVAKGWEGIMLRDPNGIYKQGRSTLREEILIKVKRFQDSEAVILSAYEQETNLNPATINEIGRSKRSSHKENKVKNGLLGGFVAADLTTGIEFSVGTFQGFTEIDRIRMWKEYTECPEGFIGKNIRYKYFPVGVKDKPRHPIMTGFRNSIDIGDNDK